MARLAPAAAVVAAAGALWACWFAVGAAASALPNYVLGTQEIYGPPGPPYHFTSAGSLEEQAQAVIKLGGNQFKMRLAKKSTCGGYGIECGDHVNSLLDLARLPEVAAVFAKPEFRWYHMWLYSFVNDKFQNFDWTPESLDAEYQETKAWARHMLDAYKGTGKVFMAGNWEGDWMLLGGSGCKHEGSRGYDKSCPVTDAAIERMIQWGKIRQKAIDDATAEAQAPDVTLLYYIEFNLGPQALDGNRTVLNNVVPEVQPDLVSYSSYSTTNNFRKAGDKLRAADDKFQQVMTLAEGKLHPKQKPELTALGFKRRTFVGEYGSHADNDGDVVRFTSRVVRSALQWGAPFILYWEMYDVHKEGGTVPIVPKSGDRTPLWYLFHAYFDRVKQLPEGSDISDWALDYFTPDAEWQCDFRPNEKDPGPGYKEIVNTKEECCGYCGQDPTCTVAIFSGKGCYLKYSTDNLQPGDGTACIKVDHVEPMPLFSGTFQSGSTIFDNTSDFEPSNETAEGEESEGGVLTLVLAAVGGVLALAGVGGAVFVLMQKGGPGSASRDMSLLNSEEEA